MAAVATRNRNPNLCMVPIIAKMSSAFSRKDVKGRLNLSVKKKERWIQSLLTLFVFKVE